MFSRDFFTEKDKAQIVQAIQQAETNTSGEIRVHLESRCAKDVLERASEVFSLLEMHKTELRNGVLFYLATEDRKFAVIGDAGINQVVPPNFWDSLKENIKIHFKEKQFAEGLSKGIIEAGNLLKEKFPYQTNDTNELPDDISYGN